MVYIWLSAYALSILLANLFLDSFIPLPYFGLLSIGTIFFAAVFTLRDRLHQYSLKAVFLGITLALTITTIFSVLYDVPVRFVMASFVSILMSELADTMVFERLKHKSWSIKVMASNAISVPLDSLLFTVMAFFGVMTYNEMLQIIFADVLVKYGIATLIAWQPSFFKSFRFGRPAPQKAI